MAEELFKQVSYKDVNGKIILSNKISVFPTANRGQDQEQVGSNVKPFNVESRLQTEFNLTNISDGHYKTYIKLS